MTDRRKKDAQWNLSVNRDGTFSPDNAQLAVLMDIRDELKKIRNLQERTIGCWKFMEMPNTIARIDKRLLNYFGPMRGKK